MVFARRSVLRAANAAQAFRAPVVRRTGQVLGRRFKSTGGKGYDEHATSDTPWYVVFRYTSANWCPYELVFFIGSLCQLV